MYAFLKVIAVHVVEDWWRGEIADKRGGGRDLVDVDGVNISDAGAASPQRVTEIRALYARIARCLAKLKNEPNYERDRGMFWLYYAYGFTAKEISELPGIGLTIKGVESTLFRLVKFVRACLNGML
jgi:DNA-directed RNA polymerase specialized sigma24 family protein